MALRSVGDGLFAEVHGTDAPAVVALHGWGRRGADFDRTLDGLDAVALDLPGFGASPAPSSATGARGYADLVEPVLRGLAAPPVLVGHSFGGRVAVVLAARTPVAGLVLTGVPLLRRTPPSAPPLGYRVLRWAHRRGLVSDDRMEAERRRRGSADYRAATGVMRDVLVASVNESYEHELAQVTAATTLVWGADDRDVPVEVAERAMAMMSSTTPTLRVLSGVGHLIPTDAPGALREAIEEMMP